MDLGHIFHRVAQGPSMNSFCISRHGRCATRSAGYHRYHSYRRNAPARCGYQRPGQSPFGVTFSWPSDLCWSVLGTRITAYPFGVVVHESMHTIGLVIVTARQLIRPLGVAAPLLAIV
ncbi:hypothetical protein PLICRDRAFT_646322 [Plicaturopsis crispa FD-325 SS-3]|nr:hypothetical protein PLICRDRAFT_646322 [Plicaturopsis crispa FD-325 SS-3]